jgi:mycofactocin precursor
MTVEATTATVEAPVSDAATDNTPELVEEDLLVEDVSIDGMCGVY